MNRRQLLLIMLIAIGWCALFAIYVARANAFDNAGAVNIAVEHYGEPCSGVVAFQWAHLGDAVNARSQWMIPDGGGPNYDCSVTWNLDVSWTPAKFCTVTEHEIGHLTGHVHGEDAIMSSYYIAPSPECTAAYPTPVNTRPHWRVRSLARWSNPRYAGHTSSKHRR